MTRLLQNAYLFKTFTNTELDGVSALGLTITYGDGDHVFETGEADHRVYFIKYGSVRISTRFAAATAWTSRCSAPAVILVKCRSSTANPARPRPSFWKHTRSSPCRTTDSACFSTSTRRRR